MAGGSSRRRVALIALAAAVLLLWRPWRTRESPRAGEPLGVHAAAGAPFSPAAIEGLLADVSAWELAHRQRDPRDWTNGVLFAGLIAAHLASPRQSSLDALLALGEENGWRPGKRLAHADDHAIAQTYLDLFRLQGAPEMIQPFQETVEQWLDRPWTDRKPHRPINWWWCDALFMSPPALAKLAAATGNGAYLDHMDRLWRETYELLYDPDQRLFLRDLRDRPRPRRYWSRGNGWVLAGLALVLEELPAEHPSRAFYLHVLREMTGRMAELQAGDGLWRSDLLSDPSESPGETSGSALVTYAMVWGIRRGGLAPDRFEPVVHRAWPALVANVDSEGRVGWVQPIDRGPGQVAAADSENYGAGALLLAGAEILELARATAERAR